MNAEAFGRSLGTHCTVDGTAIECTRCSVRHLNHDKHASFLGSLIQLLVLVQGLDHRLGDHGVRPLENES